LIKNAIKPETSFSLKNLTHSEGPLKSKESFADAPDLIPNEILYNHHREPNLHFKSSSHINDDCSMRTIKPRYGTLSKPALIQRDTEKEPKVTKNQLGSYYELNPRSFYTTNQVCQHHKNDKQMDQHSNSIR